MPAIFENKPINEVYARISKGIDFPLHLHPHMELFLVFSGEILVTVRDQERIMTAGTMAVVFPNEIHSYTALVSDVSAALVFWDLSYTGQEMNTLLMNHPVQPFLEIEQLHPNVLYLIMELIEEQKKEEHSPVYAPLIQLLLARLLPSLTLQKNRSNDFPELTYQISNYISEHFHEPLTLGQLAQHLGISKSHLSHLFSEKMGQNFASYLSSIRLSSACRLLIETNLSVTDIAEKSGFESQRSFFRTFKSHFGVTPLKYRQFNRIV